MLGVDRFLELALFCIWHRRYEKGKTSQATRGFHDFHQDSRNFFWHEDCSPVTAICFAAWKRFFLSQRISGAIKTVKAQPRRLKRNIWNSQDSHGTNSSQPSFISQYLPAPIHFPTLGKKKSSMKRHESEAKWYSGL